MTRPVDPTRPRVSPFLTSCPAWTLISEKWKYNADESVTVVDEHGLAGEEQVFRDHHRPVGQGPDRRPLPDGVVDAAVNLRRVGLAVEDPLGAETFRLW